MEFQAFSLVNGQDTYAVDFACRNGLTAEILVPERDEGLQVRRLATQVFADGIKETEKIGILLSETVKPKKTIEMLQQFVERYKAKLLKAVVDESYIYAVLFQEEARQRVGLIDEHAQGFDEQAHGQTGRKQECLVRDNGWHIRNLRKSTDDCVALKIVSNEDGHLIIGQSSFVKLSDSLTEFLKHPWLPLFAAMVFFRTENLHSDTALILTLLRNLLDDIIIS